MTRSELTELIGRNHHELSAADIKAAVDCIIDTLNAAIARGERIEIRGFGAFTVHTLAERQARNPKTGDKVLVPSRRKLHFKPGKELKEKINSVSV